MTDFQAIFLDVGQGDCTLVVLPNDEYMLIDICRQPGQGSVDVYKVLRDVLPWGKSGKPLLHYLVITHAHDDHIWGIGDLADEFEIGELWVPQYGTRKKLSENYEAFVKVVEDQPEERKVWQKGSRSPVAEIGTDGEVSVRCFSPPGYIEVEETLDEDEARRVVHENCGVYRLTHRGVSIMLTGDSNLPAWQRILGYYEGSTDENDLSVLASQAVHASHHGSRTFVKDNKDDTGWLDALEAIDPQDVVISVGAKNRHEHPHEDMVAIYREQVGTDHVTQTKDSGTLVLTITGEGTYELTADDSYAERYGWDEDGGSKSSSADGPSGGGAELEHGGHRPLRHRDMSKHRSGRRSGSATPTPELRREWHESQPGRLAWELAEFGARQLPAEDYISSSGRLVIKTALPFEGEEIELRVVFPFDYPDVEPMVLGPLRLLDRHQNRRHGNFCLLADPAVDWWPGMAAAQLIDEDLRWLLDDSAEGANAVAAGEADMPEPLSQGIAASDDEVVLIPDPLWALDIAASEGELVVREKAFGAGYMLISAEGFGSADSGLVEGFSAAKGSRHVGRWTALPDGALPPWPTHEQVLKAAEAASRSLLDRLRRMLQRERKRHEVEGWIGVTFLEEGPQRGQQRRGWVLLHVRLTRVGARMVAKAVRAQALTAAERARRIPELAGLEHLRILVVGAGSLGAPVVFELVKAGVGWTDVADSDLYDVNNAVRHVLDPRWAGVNKSIAVTLEARTLNPFVTVEPHLLHVGGGPQDSAQLDQLLACVDIVVDATGSQVAARVLQRRCREFGKTLVMAALTAGSHGGEVAVFAPGRACYYCFVLGQQDGSVPQPPEGPRSNTTPVGCSTPAFSGAGFDATALAALAARTIIRASGNSAYPELDYDYAVLAFRGGNPWRQGQLSVHVGCPLCA